MTLHARVTCKFQTLWLELFCLIIYIYNVVEAHGYGFRSTVYSEGEHSRSKTSAIVAMYDISTTRVFIKTVLYLTQTLMVETSYIAIIYVYNIFLSKAVRMCVWGSRLLLRWVTRSSPNGQRKRLTNKDNHNLALLSLHSSKSLLNTKLTPKLI